jgi:hypothetical protein
LYLELLCICPYTGYCYGVVSYKASRTLRPFPELLCVPIWFIIIPDLSTRVSVSKEARRNWARNGRWILPVSISLIPQGIFNMPQKSYDMAPPVLLTLRTKSCCGILSPLKESLAAGFEPTKVGSSGKHGNQYTTENDYICQQVTF